MAQAKPKEEARTVAVTAAEEAFLRLREDIAERNRDLTDEEMVALGDLWSEEVRSRLAERMKKLRETRTS